MPVSNILSRYSASGSMMMLGPFAFSVGTAAYKALERTTEYRWASQDRLLSSPAKQWVGKGGDTIRLSGTIYPTYNPGFGIFDAVTRSVGTGQIDRMRVMAEGGEPLMLVDGRGRVYGRWVILRVTETASAFFANGAPQKQEFSIELNAYGRDTRSAIENVVRGSDARG